MTRKILIVPSPNSYGNVAQMAIDLALSNNLNISNGHLVACPLSPQLEALMHQLYPIAGRFFNATPADSKNKDADIQQIGSGIAKLNSPTVPNVRAKLSLGVEMYRISTESQLDLNGNHKPTGLEVHIIQIRSTPLDSERFCDQLIQALVSSGEYDEIVCLTSVASSYASQPQFTTDSSSGKAVFERFGVCVFHPDDRSEVDDCLIGSGKLAKRLLSTPALKSRVSVVAKYCPDESRDNLNDAVALYGFVVEKYMTNGVAFASLQYPTSWNGLFGDGLSASDGIF